MERAILLLVLLISTAATAAAQQPASDETFDILRDLFTYEASLPLNARVVQRLDSATFRRDKFIIDGWRGSRVPGLIAFPKNNAARHPLVVLIDGIGGWKERWWSSASWNRGRLLIDNLLANGYAVAMMDAPASGERVVENDYVTAETFIGHYPLVRDLTHQVVIEHRRLLDYIATREDVDTARIGALGLSLGGMATFVLGSIEPRIKAGVAGVTPMQRMPAVLWPGHYASRIRIPLLMLAGRSDAYYTQPQTERTHSLLASNKKELIWYDVGHRLPEVYAADAVRWFRAHL